MYERGKECKILSSKTRRILGGDIVKDRTKYPHMASISVWGRHVCGGSLISDRFVITASHCFKGHRLRRRQVWVTLGRARLVDHLFDQQELRVAAVYAHPLADIALVRLQSPVLIGENVRPACLYTSRGDPRRDAIATGWGKTDHEDDMRTSPDLYEIPMEFMTEKCKLLYESKAYGIDSKNYICASGKTKKQNICRGDSGGPLQLHDDCISTVVGVASHSARLVHRNGSSQLCAGNVAKFVRVASHLRWIEDLVWPTITADITVSIPRSRLKTAHKTTCRRRRVQDSRVIGWTSYVRRRPPWYRNVGCSRTRR